jgi:hypothetical protein
MAGDKFANPQTLVNTGWPSIRVTRANCSRDRALGALRCALPIRRTCAADAGPGMAAIETCLELLGPEYSGCWTTNIRACEAAHTDYDANTEGSSEPMRRIHWGDIMIPARSMLRSQYSFG